MKPKYDKFQAYSSTSGKNWKDGHPFSKGELNKAGLQLHYLTVAQVEEM
jgi:ribosomal protein L13E